MKWIAVLPAFLLLWALPVWGGGPDLPPVMGVPASSAPLVPTYGGCGGVYLEPFDEGYEQEVVELVNAARADGGLPPLKRISSLGYSARYHAADMAQDDYFDHDSYDRVSGNLVQTCSWIDRVLSYYGSGWQGLAENIAAGYTSPSAVMGGWLGSEGHRANILNPAYREVGVGYYRGGSWGHYWVLDLGARSGVYPLVINREAAATDDRRVSLYVYGSGDWDEMRLRNDGGDWTEWQPFRSDVEWELRPVRGERAVWVEMRRGAATTVSSDTIRLDKAPALGGLPSSASFLRSLATGETVPAALRLTPTNTGDEETLTWEVTGTTRWFTVSQRTGATPGSFLVQPVGSFTGTATYAEVLTVTVTSPPGVAGSPHRIELRLRIVESPLRRLYLPVVGRQA